MKVIVAGRYAEALDWCRQNDVNPHAVKVLARPGDENTIRGMELSDADVVWVGSWAKLSHDTLEAFRYEIKWAKAVRLVVDDHDVDDLAGSADLADHMHQVHHWALGAVRHYSVEALDLAHADDHDDLRRGCG